MGFIDGDEFVFVRGSAGGAGSLYRFVDEFMTSHPNAGGLGVNWCIFGSNHHEKRPEGGVLENYTMCAEKDFPPNHFVKTICDPAKTMLSLIHDVVCFRGFRDLNENGDLVSSTSLEVSFDKIRINHYFCKSLEEYTKKRNRGKADKNDVRPMSDFTDYDQNVIHDTEILSHM